MYARYLAKRLPIYLTAGLLAGLLLGTNIFFHRYNGELSAIVEKTRILGVKRAQITRETRELQDRVTAFEAFIPDRVAQTEGATLLLWGVDRLNERFRRDMLDIGTMGTDGETVTMPVEIRFPFDGYSRLIRRIDRLERQRFPFFELERFDFVKGPDRRALCSLKGRLLAPGTAGGDA